MKNLCVKLGGFGAVNLLTCCLTIHQGSRFNPVSYFIWSTLSDLYNRSDSCKKGGWMTMAGYVLSIYCWLMLISKVVRLSLAFWIVIIALQLYVLVCMCGVNLQRTSSSYYCEYNSLYVSWIPQIMIASESSQATLQLLHYTLWSVEFHMENSQP
jgi:hypothetical protein